VLHMIDICRFHVPYGARCDLEDEKGLLSDATSVDK
jgi:hypothetical protein